MKPVATDNLLNDYPAGNQTLSNSYTYDEILYSFIRIKMGRIHRAPILRAIPTATFFCHALTFIGLRRFDSPLRSLSKIT